MISPHDVAGGDTEHPLDVTPEEERLGFGIFLMVLDDVITLSRKKKLRKVVLKVLGDSDAIFKTWNPFTKSVGYKHRCYGRKKEYADKVPDWIPVGDVVFDSASGAVNHSHAGCKVPYFDVERVAIEFKKA